MRVRFEPSLPNSASRANDGLPRFGVCLELPLSATKGWTEIEKHLREADNDKNTRLDSWGNWQHAPRTS